METKNQIQSKTNWAAALIILLSQLTELLEDPAIIEFIGSNVGWIGTGIGVAMFILRQFTNKGVKWKKNLEILDEGHQSDDVYGVNTKL